MDLTCVRCSKPNTVAMWNKYGACPCCGLNLLTIDTPTPPPGKQPETVPTKYCVMCSQAFPTWQLNHMGRCASCETTAQACDRSPIKPQPDPRAKYRAAAESCGRDGIEVECRYSMDCTDYIRVRARQPDNSIMLQCVVDCDDDPANWYDQALALVQRVHRLRELLRQAGESI